MTQSQNLKALTLTVLIAVAVLLKCAPARAAEMQTLTVAGGCFWCVEADFEKVAGVSEVVSGYTGGTVKNPTYKQVTRGGTGHYEAARIYFDPSVISRETLLDLFFRSVDPTDAGGQFCDRGESYRTAIFVSNAGETALAERTRAQAQIKLGQTVVTPILPEGEFYPAEDYHQNYYKGKSLVLTRFGPKRQSEAYKKYRQACGRDAQVRKLWGSSAAFSGS